MNAIKDFISQHWVISLIIAIVAVLIIVFVVVIPFIFKIIGMLKKNKETVAIKQDLMIWHRLAGLARGGDKADKSKNALMTGQIALLHESFRNGIKLLKEHRLGKYDTPWYISVGEPSCGKSLLMTCSDITMVPSEVEKTEQNGEVRSLPLRFWLGAQSVVLDVGGKAFFDRWFGGSSAEWNEIIKLVKSYHGKKPLSGIILTIPADSLIADDEELCRKKVTIIAAELQKLMSSVSMHLPCYIIISKMDVVTGFRDYFAELDENMRRKCFGWDNTKSINGYDKLDFSTFWNMTLESLRNARNTLLLSNSSQPARKEGRIEKAANIFMFPEAFDGLYSNLDKYLKGIFGMQKIHGLDNLRLGGVYFTSARDGGITYNANFAKHKGVPIDDAPMVGGKKNLTSFFVTDTLADKVFHDTQEAYLTKRAQFTRRIPYYASAAAFLCLAGFWSISVAIHTNDMRESLMYDTAYFNKLSDIFAEKALSNSPLVTVDSAGKGVLLFNEPMYSDPSISRIDFFLTARNDIAKANSAPFGFKLSSLIMFRATDIEYRRKQMILNKIQTSMAFLPLVSALEKNLVLTENEPVTMSKRNALIELFKLVLFYENSNGRQLSVNTLYERNTMESFLAYIFPQMAPEIKSILQTFNPKYDIDSNITNAAVIFDPNFAKGIAAGVRSIINGWANLTGYPLSSYYLAKQLIEDSGNLYGLLAQIKTFSPSEQDTKNMQALATDIAAWYALYNKENILFNNVNESLKLISGYYASSPTAALVSFADNSSMLLLKKSYNDYVKLFNDDMAFLEEYGQYALQTTENYIAYIEKVEKTYLSKLKSDVLKKLNAEYESLTNQDVISKTRILLEDTVGEKGKIADENATQPNDFILNYEVTGVILESAVLPKFDATLKSAADFENKWRKLSDESAMTAKKLEANILKYKGTPFGDAISPLAAEMLERQIIYNKILLAESAIFTFPQSSAQLVTIIAAMGVPEEYGDVFSREGGGYNAKAAFRQEFNPGAANAFIKPFGFLRAIANEKGTDGAPSYVAAYISSNPHYKALARVLDDYGNNFIKYWGQFGDSLAPAFADYPSFHRFVSTSKAYAINTHLYSTYEASSSLLISIDDSMLTLDAAAEKKLALSLLDARRKALNIQFSDSCAKLLAAWGSLPQSANEANKLVMNMSDVELRTELFMEFGSGNNITTIPWWDSLVLNGTRLLKADASQNAAKTIKQYQRYFGKFPLLADGDVSSVLSWEEMRTLADILNDFGWVTDTTPATAPDMSTGTLSIKAPLKLQGIVKNEKAVKGWGTVVMSILQALSGGPKPLQWMLVIPDAEMQTKLTEGYLGATSAMARFRYAEVKHSFDKVSARFPTSAGQGKELTPLKDSADMEDMVFDFYTHSSSAAPDASVSVKGAWAPIRLYLKDESVKDEEKGVYYVPLTLNDEMGIEYVFFIGLKFNKPLPEPDKWPSSYNWPEFSYTPERKNINNALLSGTSKVFNAGLFFADYR